MSEMSLRQYVGLIACLVAIHLIFADTSTIVANISLDNSK